MLDYESTTEFLDACNDLAMAMDELRARIPKDNVSVAARLDFLMSVWNMNFGEIQDEICDPAALEEFRGE